MFDVMNCDALCHRSNGHADWFQPMAFLAILDAGGVLQGRHYQTYHVQPSVLFESLQ